MGLFDSWDKATLLTPSERATLSDRFSQMLNSLVPSYAQQQYREMKQSPETFLASGIKNPPTIGQQSDIIQRLGEAMPIAYHGTPHEWAASSSPKRLYSNRGPEGFEGKPSLKSAFYGEGYYFGRTPQDVESLVTRPNVPRQVLGADVNLKNPLLWDKPNPNIQSLANAALDEAKRLNSVSATQATAVLNSKTNYELNRALMKIDGQLSGHFINTGARKLGYDGLVTEGQIVVFDKRSLSNIAPATEPRPDMSKIGTGQGAQSYGHGLYFAENPEVAKTYAPMDRTWQQIKSGGAPRGGNLYQVNIPDEHVAKMLDWDKPLSEQAPEVKKNLMGAIVKAFKRAEADFMQNPTDATKAEMVARLRNVGTANQTGQEIYQMLTGIKGWNKGQAAKDASDFLREAGIPGIKYLDQGSRKSWQVINLQGKGDPAKQFIAVVGKSRQAFGTMAEAERWAHSEAYKEGTRNFVVFDPSIITDVRKK